MYMTTYEPWNVLNNLNREVGRLLDSTRTGADDGSSVATSAWTPAVDIKEEEGRFLITADVPGVEPQAIDVTMENGMLTIKGERKMESDVKENGFRRVERMHGTFYRRFSLPDYADADNISANCKNGVLTVTVPKTEAVKPRRIEVKA
ncbi:MAG TPA: Hsp20/alpha crystallin family protein [Gammaproteobacteria bacterium]|nr:Hsp20/alpha crystallin family protein [Gammaproteobacteria bacterium]